MTQDIFLYLDGIAGESLDSDHPGEMEVSSWHWKIYQDSTMLAGSGMGVPRATVQDLVVVHQIDRSSPNLMTYCLNGRHIPRAILTMRKAGGAPLDFYCITMDDVVITSVEPSGSAGGFYEQLGLSFARIKQEYVLQNNIGGSAGMVTGAFDIRNNRQA